MRRCVGALPSFGDSGVSLTGLEVSKGMQGNILLCATQEYAAFMTRTISQEEFAKTAPDLLQAVGQQTILIERGGRTVAALVSAEQYESTREARAERAIRAMHRLGDYLHTVATPEELKELERALDRKAPE